MKNIFFTALLAVLTLTGLTGQSTSLQSKCGCTTFTSSKYLDLNPIVTQEVTKEARTVIEVGIKEIIVRQAGASDLIFPVASIKKNPACPGSESRIYTCPDHSGTITVVYTSQYLDTIQEVYLDLPGRPIRVYYK